MFKAAHRRAAVVVAVCAVVLVASAGPATAQGTTVVCESTQGERAFCSADTSKGVTLQRQLGDAPCTGNWGSDENGIWVTNRCRGEFLLGQAGGQDATASSVLSTWIDRITGGDSTPTPSSEGVVVCESNDNKRVTCPVDTRGGVELQRQLSSASCTGAWGYTPDGIWVDNGCRAEFRVYPVQASIPTPAPEQILVCESMNNQRAFCSADTRGGVVFQRQLGQATCVGHWGYDSGGVWVDNGCRAEFRIAHIRPQSTILPGSGSVVTCESNNSERSYCPADTRSGVTLQRQLSSAACVGHWGYDALGIWVDSGCRAEFVIR